MSFINYNILFLVIILLVVVVVVVNCHLFFNAQHVYCL